MEIFNLLSGVKNPIKIPFNKYNTKGVSKGKLIGGNLSEMFIMLNIKFKFFSKDNWKYFDN